MVGLELEADSSAGSDCTHADLKINESLTKLFISSRTWVTFSASPDCIKSEFRSSKYSFSSIAFSSCVRFVVRSSSW
jgi:hypothetical protein